MFGQNRSRNSHCQVHKQLATQQDGREGSKPSGLLLITSLRWAELQHQAETLSMESMIQLLPYFYGSPAQRSVPAGAPTLSMVAFAKLVETPLSAPMPM
jgi:hypothetical protein